MLNYRGLYLPDGEAHLTAWMDKVNRVVDGKPTYQYHKLERALSYCKNWRVAVDVGAHCGLWSMHLVNKFEMVEAFEPVAAHRQCFRENVSRTNYDLHECALGEEDGSIAIHTAADSSGDSWVDGSGDIPMKCLDDFRLHDVDFMKLDCEGYELFALRGAEATLLRCRPVVCVEQKPGRAQKFGLHETGAVDYLRGLGAHLKTVMSGDYILAWND